MSTQIDEILENAAAYAEAFPGPSAAVPARRLAIVTCMDARIDALAIFGLRPGEAHVMRNAGGLASDDVLRSLVISQRLLGTREIVLMHHAKCGLDGADEPALRRAIAAETGAEPDYAFGAFSGVDDAVRAALARVRAHPFLPHRDGVRGFVYEVETGRVREVV